MTTLDWTRVPVVVGAGQITNREEAPLAAPDPFELMVEAAERAARSSGSVTGGGNGSPITRLSTLTHLWMVHSLSLRHGDPARFLAEKLGANDAEACCSGMGGSVPQWLADRAAEIVCDGSRPRVLVVGAEALATRRRAKKAGVHLEWPSAPGWPDTWPALEPDMGVHPVERAHGLDQATAMYALVETALSHAAGDGPEAHERSMGELMERFNAVAASNPNSWFPQRRGSEELTTVTPENRMIYFPYPKYMNAVMDVDMAAAVIITDAATAREWGLAPDEVAYLAGWADAHDIWYLSQRPRVEHSEALTMCATEALGGAGLSVDDVSAFDLYSCFPSSIEVARDSLGVSSDDPRPLTLTGGLPYHGGPGSNYVTHSIANTLDWLRSGAGDSVVVHGNGYYLTKHSVGVYTRAAPSSAPHAPEKLQERFDALAEPLAIDEKPDGTGSVVAYTSLFDRDGAPGTAAVLVDLDGLRTAARADPALTAALLEGDGVGTKVSVSASSEGNTATSA